MTHQYAGQFPTHLAQRPSRPKALVAAVVTALTAGALGVLAGFVLLSSGREAIETYMRETLGADLAAAAASLVSDEIEHAVSVLETKAITAIVFSTLVVVLALLMLKASRVARALFVVVALANVGVSFALMADADILPSTAVVAAMVSVLVTFVAIVMIFLPPVNRYGKALRTAR